MLGRAPSTVLPHFSGVLLDMNGTFMFDGDRFGSDQDYAATYRALGGDRLSAEAVQRIITACFDMLSTVYEDPAACDAFPQVYDALRRLSLATDLPESELRLLERVIAEHERGHVPETYAHALQRLAATHRLGVVSNLLLRKELWLEELARSLRFDVAGAAGIGLATVWIDRAGRGLRTGDPEPDFIVRDLLELIGP